MEKSQADYYLYRIYRLLKSNEFPIVLKRLRKWKNKEVHGETDFETILLNPNLSLLPTFIHECLHIFYPDSSESNVAQMEKQIITKLTIKQLNNLLLRLALAINNKPS